MPYCAQCGKIITDEILIKNNGECNECSQTANILDSKLMKSASQESIGSLKKSVNCLGCGKVITPEMRMKNNGQCNECAQKGKVSDLHAKLISAQISTHSLNKCAYCNRMTSVRCESCGKAACQSHLEAYKGQILCPDCMGKNIGIRCVIACVVLVIAFIFLAAH